MYNAFWKIKKLPPLHAKDESLTSAVPPLLMIQHPTRKPGNRGAVRHCGRPFGDRIRRGGFANSFSLGNLLSGGPRQSLTGPVITFTDRISCGTSHCKRKWRSLIRDSRLPISQAFVGLIPVKGPFPVDALAQSTRAL